MRDVGLMQRANRMVAVVWIAALLTVAGTATMTAVTIRSERDNALALAREALSRMAVTLAAHAERVIADAEHGLEEANLLLPLLTPDEIADRVGHHRRASRQHGARPVSTVVLLDRNGAVLAPSSLIGENYADDPLLREALAAPADRTLFGAPRESGRTGELMIPLSMRAVDNAHGVAVLTAGVPLAPFLALFQQIRPSGSGGAALFREDGMLMVGQPFGGEEAGYMFRGGVIQAFAKADSGVEEMIAQVDGVRWMVAFKRAGNFPFFTTIGNEYGLILETIAERVRALTALAALACLLILAGAAYATRQLRRDARQVAALEASRAALDRVAMIAEETQASVIVTDRDGRTEWVNPAFTRTTGFAHEDIVGRKPGELLQGPETDADTAGRIGAAVRAGKPFDVEILNYTKTGEKRWIQLIGNPVQNEAGTITHFIAVQTDVTARREAEARVAEASRLASLGQLAGSVAHDVNNLLMVISLNLELLAESGLDESGEALAQAALAATIRGHDLTKQLLSFAQRATDPSHATDATGLLAMLLPLLARSLPDGIKLVSDLRCHGQCRGDPGIFESAVTNLVVNARDALGTAGTIVVECANHEVTDEEAATRAISPGRYMRITVSDDGPGIPREILGRVLDPFFTTKAQGKGTGLGLSTAYGFARQAGGTLTIDSTVGEGTTVTLLLPLIETVDAVRKQGDARSTSLRGLTALVVDDEPQILTLLDRTLRAAGLEVMLALDPVQARASMEAVRPDVLLADVRLAGGQSGVEVVEAARERWPDLPVIFMTGDPGPQFAARVATLRNVAVLQKPFAREEMMAALRTAVTREALSPITQA